MTRGKSKITPIFFTRRRRTILVAGGAGFVGSHLTYRLVEEGHNVICVDNFQTGNIANLDACAGRPGFRIIRQDISEPLQISDKIDEIYNMACAASPDRYQANPVHTAKTCFQGTLNLLELAKFNRARILQSSTSEVYGDPEIPLQSEDYRGNVNTCGPRACYDEGKRIAETLFWEYGAHLGVETRIARIFNTYGSQMDPQDGRVVSNFITQALENRELTIYGTGEQTRSFCHVSDLVEGLMRLMASKEKMPVNLGNPVEFTMLELAQQVLQKTDSTVGITFRPLPQDDPRQRRPDIDRARKLLDWEPKVSLSDGLDMTIDWYRLQLQAKMEAVALVGE